MDLGELARKIDKLKTSANGRAKAANNEGLRHYAQGFCDALDDVTNIIKQAREAERMRQRLAKLEDNLSQEPQLNWSRTGVAGKEPANTTGTKGDAAKADANETAA